MAYVITDGCLKDELCMDACPVDCIHPRHSETEFERVSQLYIDPAECIDCGACSPVCPTAAIFPAEELPANLAAFSTANAEF